MEWSWIVMGDFGKWIIEGSMLLPYMGSWITLSGESQLPCHLNSQKTQWRGSYGKRMKACWQRQWETKISQQIYVTEPFWVSVSNSVSQVFRWLKLWHLNWQFMKDLEPEPPKLLQNSWLARQWDNKCLLLF